MRWAAQIIAGLLLLCTSGHAQTIWEPDPTRDPNTIHVLPGEDIPRYLQGMTTKNCPFGNYVRVKRWECLVAYRTLLESPGRYYGKDIHIHGFVHIMPGGQVFLMPGNDIKDGYEKIRIEAAPALRSLKDGDPIFIGGRFGPEDVVHKPDLGVLSSAHDVVLSDEYPDNPSLLPGLRLKSPKPAADSPPKFDIAPGRAAMRAGQ